MHQRGFKIGRADIYYIPLHAKRVVNWSICKVRGVCGRHITRTMGNRGTEMPHHCRALRLA